MPSAKGAGKPELVEAAARQMRPTRAIWVKAHTRMELNKGVDIQAKAEAALDEDRCWHKTDFGSLLYQDLSEEEAYMQPGTSVKRYARDFSLKVKLGRCSDCDSVTSQWLLRQGQGQVDSTWASYGRGLGGTSRDWHCSTRSSSRYRLPCSGTIQSNTGTLGAGCACYTGTCTARQ